jgi:hypothetical protein
MCGAVHQRAAVHVICRQWFGCSWCHARIHALHDSAAPSVACVGPYMLDYCWGCSQACLLQLSMHIGMLQLLGRLIALLGLCMPLMRR